MVRKGEVPGQHPQEPVEAKNPNVTPKEKLYFGAKIGNAYIGMGQDIPPHPDILDHIRHRRS